MAYHRYDQVSPFASMAVNGVPPDVTENDYSYITSQDLIQDMPPNPNDDDVLIFKNRAHEYSTPFPAYSIGDGKLLVRDIRKRVKLLLDLSDRQAKRARLVYKGKQLKDMNLPVREYGVKNKSEILVIVPSSRDVADVSEDSDEEEIVVEEDVGPDPTAGHGSPEVGRGRRSARRRTRNRQPRHDAEQATSPRSSGTSVNMPQTSPAYDKNASPETKKNLTILAELKATLEKLLPECRAFLAAPPTDKKKRDDEHRRLTETILQHVILKADNVVGDGDIRLQRRDLIKRAQEQLTRLDAVTGKES